MLPWPLVPPLSSVLVLLLTVFLAGAAEAQSSAKPAAEFNRVLANLKHEDFRVRTQAALALGVSKDPRAAGVLCRALGDPSAPVRAAAAAALGRLANGGLSCLEQRYPVEPNGTVRAAIERAVELVFEGFRITDRTRVYVAIASLADQSGRVGVEFPKLARTAMLNAGKGFSDFAFAPAWESAAAAKQRLAGRPSLKAFYLSPRLPPFEYRNGNLTVKLEVAMFSYPEKSLLGNFNVRLTQPDVEQEDPDSERDLVKMAAERAMQKFAKLAPML